MVTEVMENYRNKEVGLSPLILAKAPTVIENHQDYQWKKILNLFNKNKAIIVISYVVN